MTQVCLYASQTLQTYMSEHDFLRQLHELEARGCGFFPMTTDEIILAERLCNKGILRREGSKVCLFHRAD